MLNVTEQISPLSNCFAQCCVGREERVETGGLAVGETAARALYGPSEGYNAGPPSVPGVRVDGGVWAQPEYRQQPRLVGLPPDEPQAEGCGNGQARDASPPVRRQRRPAPAPALSLHAGARTPEPTGAVPKAARSARARGIATLNCSLVGAQSAIAETEQVHGWLPAIGSPREGGSAQCVNRAPTVVDVDCRGGAPHIDWFKLQQFNS